MINNDNIALVISSCDLYSDCWGPLFKSLKINWPDTKIPKYLICNEMDSCDRSIKDIKVGEHLGWGSNTKKALETIDTDYILLIQEDYFLNKPLCDDVINKHVSYCVDHDIDYLRLGAPFRDKFQSFDYGYCCDPLEMKYSLCLQPAIWKKETLQKLTIDGWTGWDFERKIHSYIYDNKIQIKSEVICSQSANEYGYNMVRGTGIRKGIWTQGGLKFLKENGFKKEMKGRGHEGRILSAMMNVEDDSYFKFPARVMVRIIQKYKGLI